jgi:hypothetical protein
MRCTPYRRPRPGRPPLRRHRPRAAPAPGGHRYGRLDPTHAALAERTGACSERTVRRALKALATTNNFKSKVLRSST